VALAAGLGVVDGAEAVSALFDLVEGFSVRLMRHCIDEAIGGAIERCGRFLGPRLCGFKRQTQSEQGKQGKSPD
jgi:hypothetical protein